MQWNELDYETQMKILDRIGDLINQEKDVVIQYGIAAAINELEIWSNSPIREVTSLEDMSKETFVETKPVSPEFIEALRNAGARKSLVCQLEREAVEAQDVVGCCTCWLPWFCKCLCHKREQ